MAGCISRRFRERSSRLALLLGFVLAAVALAPAADTDPADGVHVTAVRYWSLGETTRIAIEVSSEFRFKSERLANPDRLFFDIFGARPDMARRGMQAIPVDDTIVRQLRVAETQPGVTRVVIDLKQPAEMTTSQLTSPNRLMIEVKASRSAPSSGEVSESPNKSAQPAPGSSAGHKQAAPASAPERPPDAVPGPKPKSPDVVAKAVTPQNTPPSVTSTIPQQPAAKPSSTSAVASSPRSGDEHAEDRAVRDAAAAKTIAAIPTLPPEPVAAEPPASASESQYDVKEDARGEPRAVLPAKRGSSSLTRALALKLGRVVIDPGHGGTDVGAHGPSGYFEKDLTLDVAKRLAALVKDNMGSDVVLTRSDDVYVGLEERTRIANEHKADLFLSIHANSSPYRSAAGVETYVLSFTTSKTAMDLASRENAGSQLSIHELQDLLQKIALRDKIEESHELATRLQSSLSVLSTKTNDIAKNRGVRKAPFVVLIGANMPSVLAEIGFLTNSGDETLLRKPEHRQKIAEALYKGISAYAETLSQVVARKN